MRGMGKYGWTESTERYENLDQLNHDKKREKTNEIIYNSEWKINILYYMLEKWNHVVETDRLSIPFNSYSLDCNAARMNLSPFAL